MSRKLLDPNFREWEAYATTGRFGLPEHAYIVFHCLTDRAQPPRFFRTDGTKAAAERDVARLSDSELLARLDRSRVFRPARESTEPVPAGIPGAGTSAGDARRALRPRGRPSRRAPPRS